MSAAVLVCGPARSGKSEWAERLAERSGRAVVYVATAREDAEDADWCARIARHRARRPAHWTTQCAPFDLEQAIARHAGPEVCLLIDSLGTWVANLLDLDEPAWEARVVALADRVRGAAGTVILVAEETGWGVIPAYPIGRLFRDRLGALVRRLAPLCGSTYVVMAGHVLDLSQLGQVLDGD